MADLTKGEVEEYIWVNNDYTGVNSKEADPNVKVFVQFPIIKQINDGQENSNSSLAILTVNESIPHRKQDEKSTQDKENYIYRSTHEAHESKINELNELLKKEQKKTEDLEKLVKKLDTELNTKSKALQKAEEQIEEQKVKIEQLTSRKCESIEGVDKYNSVLITKSKNESTEKQIEEQKRKPLPEVPAENKKTTPTTATTTVTSTNVILESNQQRESTTKLKISFKDFFAPVTNPRPVSTGMY